MNARASENYLAIARSASKSVEIFWAEIYFRAESSLIQSSCRSFILVIVPYEKQYNKMTFITHEFRVSMVSDVRERERDLGSPLRFMLRRYSLVECVSVLHGTCLQCVEFFVLSISMCSHVCQKILSTHFIP